jgi:hypothetical protein
VRLGVGDLGSGEEGVEGLRQLGAAFDLQPGAADLIHELLLVVRDDAEQDECRLGVATERGAGESSAPLRLFLVAGQGALESAPSVLVLPSGVLARVGGQLGTLGHRAEDPVRVVQQDLVLIAQALEAGPADELDQDLVILHEGLESLHVHALQGRTDDLLARALLAEAVVSTGVDLLAHVPPPAGGHVAHGLSVLAEHVEGVAGAASFHDLGLRIGEEHLLHHGTQAIDHSGDGLQRLVQRLVPHLVQDSVLPMGLLRPVHAVQELVSDLQDQCQAGSLDDLLDEVLQICGRAGLRLFEIVGYGLRGTGAAIATTVLGIGHGTSRRKWSGLSCHGPLPP